MKDLILIIIKFLWAIVGLYGVGVTVYTVLQFTIGERFVVVAWLNNGAYLLWAGAIVLIVPSILFRKYHILALMIIPALAFTINYLPMYLPRTVTPPPNTKQLKLLTYNINLAPANIVGIANDIWRVDADIVAIQELTFHSADILEDRFAEHYPYRAFHPVDGFSGQGILSKYPIVYDDYWAIHLGHQHVQLDIDGEIVNVFNVHPVHHISPTGGLDVSRRIEEVDVILDKAKQSNAPTLIMGDFNMTDQSADYQRLTETYHDSYRKVGYGMGTTFPGHIPFSPTLVRIDYVFHSDKFTAINADVLRSTGGSDHRPLVVTLALDS